MMQGFGSGRLRNPCGLSEVTQVSCGTVADGLICHMRKHQQGARKMRKRKTALVAKPAVYRKTPGLEPEVQLVAVA